MRTEVFQTQFLFEPLAERITPPSGVIAAIARQSKAGHGVPVDVQFSPQRVSDNDAYGEGTWLVESTLGYPDRDNLIVLIYPKLAAHLTTELDLTGPDDLLNRQIRVSGVLGRRIPRSDQDPSEYYLQPIIKVGLRQRIMVLPATR